MSLTLPLPVFHPATVISAPPTPDGFGWCIASLHDNDTATVCLPLNSVMNLVSRHHSATFFSIVLRVIEDESKEESDK